MRRSIFQYSGIGEEMKKFCISYRRAARNNAASINIALEPRAAALSEVFVILLSSVYSHEGIHREISSNRKSAYQSIRCGVLLYVKMAMKNIIT